MLEDERQAENEIDDDPSRPQKRSHLVKRSKSVSRRKQKVQSMKTALVVVGMHRSGTSAISRVLNLLGADVPKKMLPPRPSNPTGFWESKDLMTLHDKMLHAVGGSWDDPGYLPEFWGNHEFKQAYHKKFAEIINNEYDESSFFVLKDPRISRFVPLTAASLQSLDIAPKFVIALRNPLEVAASLKKRDEFHLAKSLLLWLDHSLRVEKMTRDWPRTFVLYDELLKGWRSVVRAAASELDVTFPAWSPRNDVLIESFVSPKLSHHTFSLDDIMLREDVAQWVKVAYETLRMLAHGQSVSANQKKLNRIYSEFKKAQKAFSPVLAQQQITLQRISKEREEVQKDLVQREKSAEELSGAIEQSRREIVDLRSRYEAAIKYRNDASEKSEKHEKEISGLSSELESIRKHHQNLREKYAEAIKARDDAVEQAATHIQTVDRISKDLVARKSEAGELRAEYELAVKERDDFAREAADKAQEIKALSEQLSAIESEFEGLLENRDSVARERDDAFKKADKLAAEKKDLSQQVARQIDVASVLREQLACARQEHEALRSSYLWRMGSPIRALGASCAGFSGKAGFAAQVFKVARTQGLKKTRQLLEDRRLLLASALFNPEYYVKNNPDVTESGIDPASHYLLHGGESGRNPNPLFDTGWYLNKYRDVARSGMNPLRHFLLFGAREKRDPNPLFQTRWYLQEYPDVVTSGVNPLVHYLLFGGMEGRKPNPLFDGEWYLKQNPAVAEAGINPLIHYREQGWREGRNPSEGFDGQFYLENNHDVAASGANPLAHYLEIGRIEGRAALRPAAQRPLPYLSVKGSKSQVRGWHTILIVAHFVSERLFGAERSFLDMLDGLSKLNVNVVAALPKDLPLYTEEVRKRCSSVAIFEYDWWKKGNPVSEKAIEKFESVIANHQIDAVHVNTIMLREPLVAASNRDVASVVHVRELICDDKWLSEAIGKPPEKIVEDVLSGADWIIANSETTRKAFEKEASTFVIPNPVDLDDLNIPNVVDSANVRFGLISSNIRKKGIEDLVELARACDMNIPNARFVLIGPETKLIKKLRDEQARGTVPGNIEFAGYADSPRCGIEKTNVVLNLSHFKESFGRTVVEAMAARRPTIAYDWGALPELVTDGVTGYLVPVRRPEQAVSAVRELCCNVQKLAQMGEAARTRAVENYSKHRYAEQLRRAYLTIFNQDERAGAISSDQGRQPDGLMLDDSDSRSILLVEAESERVLGCRGSRADDGPGGATREPAKCGSKSVGAERGIAEPNDSLEREQVDVSVIVPNYNYAAYLPERLRSILEQSVQPREIIFIDDASQDQSVEVARAILEGSDIPFRIEVNQVNVGPYANWKKGLFLAQGSYVWIAEADDTCDPRFLETVTAPVRATEDIVISYTQSRKIDGSGETITEDSFAHTDEISPSRWRSSYVEPGVREVVDALAYRNTIPNVSACLIQRAAAVDASCVLDDFRYCGDWAFYARLLKGGRIAYDHRSFNFFRRHEQSQTRRTFKSADFIVEVARVREVICRDFPLRLNHFARMDHFLNKDYPVENIEANAAHPPVARIIDSAAAHARQRKMIAFVTTNNGSYTGGSEVLWREAAMALRKAGHDVIVLIKKWDPAPEFFREFESAGIKLYFKDDQGFDSVLSHTPDLVVISTGDQDEGIEYFGELIERDIAYIIVNQLTKEERFWPIRAEKQEAVREGYTKAARAFFTCKNNHRVMEARLRCTLDNADYHFNPFHIDRNNVPEFPEISSGYRVAVPSKLLYIHKGQDLLIEVLKQKQWKDRDLFVNIYGVGDDREKMEKSVADLGIRKVAFRGRVPDISEIWIDNHSILMPSRMEGLPIMLVSAMLSARVPILTDVGGHAELVEDGICGFIARNPEVASIDEAMERAWAVREEWQAYGERARRRVLEFLPDDPVEDFLSKIASVFKEHIKVKQAVE